MLCGGAGGLSHLYVLQGCKIINFPAIMQTICSIFATSPTFPAYSSQIVAYLYCQAASSAGNRKRHGMPDKMCEKRIAPYTRTAANGKKAGNDCKRGASFSSKTETIEVCFHPHILLPLHQISRYLRRGMPTYPTPPHSLQGEAARRSQRVMRRGLFLTP